MATYSFGSAIGSLCFSIICALPFAIVAAIIAFFLLKKKEGSRKYMILLAVFLGVMLLCGGCAFVGSLLSNYSYY